MKKVITLLLTLIICISLCACNTNTSSTASTAPTASTASTAAAKIVDNEGNVVEKTSKQLRQVYKDNNAQFDKYYKNANISFTGTISKIDSNFKENGSPAYDAITFEEGWRVYIKHEINQVYALAGVNDGVYDFAELKIGDKLNVDATIIGVFTEVNVGGEGVNITWAE